MDLIIPNMVETLKITNAGITENDFLTNINITIPDVDQMHSVCSCVVRGTSLHTFKAGTLCVNVCKYNALFYSESMIEDKVNEDK